jgi:hypothetical protein
MSGLSFVSAGACTVHAASTSAFLRGDSVGQATGLAVGAVQPAKHRRVSQTRVGKRPLFRACLHPQAQSGGFALADLPALPIHDAPERPGAYAVRNSDGGLAYLGYSRNVATMLRFHEERVGAEKAASCQVYAPEDLPVGPDLLEAVLEYWVRENDGVVPDGNLANRALWEGSGKNAAPGTPEAHSQQQKVLTRTIFAFFLVSSVLKFMQYHFFPY